MSPKKPDALVCPHCKRPYQFGREKCVWCGGALPADATADFAPDCPSCGTALEAQEDGDIRVFACPKCWGLWMSLDTLKRFERLYEGVSPLQPVGQTPQKAAGRDGLAGFNHRHQVRACPVCRKEMARRRYQRVSNFVIDECMAHGMWFDPGEFEMAVEFLSQGGLDRSKAAEGRFQPSLGGFAALKESIDQFNRMCHRSILGF